MSKILGISKLREHNQSSLVLTLTGPAKELGLGEGDYLKIVQAGSKIQLVPVEENQSDGE